MKTIKDIGAQGDILVMRIDEIPTNAREVESKNRVIVAHSETGHDHYLEPTGVQFYEHTDPLVCFLRVEGAFADIMHARPFDTHETIRLPRGLYKIHRQREMTPEGWQQVQD